MMDVKRSALALCLSAFPLLSCAHDLTVVNNTNTPATGSVNVLCSSVAGDAGIAKPHSSMVLPQEIIDIYCKKNCEVSVFMSKNCSENKVAIVGVDAKQGILWVKNIANKGNYTVSGSGNTATIEGGPQHNWLLDWFK